MYHVRTFNIHSEIPIIVKQHCWECEDGVGWGGVDESEGVWVGVGSVGGTLS